MFKSRMLTVSFPTFKKTPREIEKWLFQKLLSLLLKSRSE